MVAHLRTLFLHPPSFKGFDGGAGARYQARREIRSFWYPTWLAQTAALVPGSRLVDAPPAGLTLDDVAPLARDYELAVLHTSAASFAHDVGVAEALKRENPRLRIGFVGAHVAVERERALGASPAIEFVAGNEFDFTIQEIAQGRSLASVAGLSYRVNGHFERTPERAPLENMDALPFVIDVYHRDLVIEHYFIGYLLHPYVSLYTGRGCRSRCTFCLWPQTVGGHRYRTRSVEHVVAEIAQATRHFPTVKEYFFDDDTFTDDLARDIDPDSLQVSLAAPYPGTALYREALERGWLAKTELVDAGGTQTSVLGYPHLSREEIFASVERFYRRFYFRPRKLFGFLKEMARDFAVCKRRLAEGREFLKFLARRHSSA